jgi:hypothetical protein
VRPPFRSRIGFDDLGLLAALVDRGNGEAADIGAGRVESADGTVDRHRRQASSKRFVIAYRQAGAKAEDSGTLPEG